MKISKRNYIEDRVINIASYILNTGATVRVAAEHFKVSKSTVHKDMVERLPILDGHVAESIREVLDNHLEDRHIRGGQATKEKYSN